MCRYAITAYKPHYACFNCQKTFKRRLLHDIDREFRDWEKKPYKCPECTGNMADMGLDFESPKKTNNKAWKHIKDLYQSGTTFHSCGCTGPGYIPKDKFSLICFLTEKKDIYIKHLRFWSTREEPKTESEKAKDRQENGDFLFQLPNIFTTGTKKQRRTDIEKAVIYWRDRVNEIETHLKKATVDKL